MKRNGFTLVEILIVCVVLGILAAIVIPQFVGVSKSSGNKENALVSSDFEDERPYFYYKNQKLVEARVLVPSDCLHIKGVTYISFNGEKKQYEVEVDGVVIWQPDLSKLPPGASVLNESKTLGKICDIRQ